MNPNDKSNTIQFLIISDALSSEDIEKLLNENAIETKVLSDKEKVRSGIEPTTVAASLFALKTSIDITKMYVIPFFKSLRKNHKSKNLRPLIAYVEPVENEEPEHIHKIELDSNDAEFNAKLLKIMDLAGIPQIYITFKKNGRG